MKESILKIRRTGTLFLMATVLICISCGNSKKATAETVETTTANSIKAPAFNADSAYAYTAAQCSFGPRIMNSTAHKQCGDYIVKKFKEFGATVTEQETLIPPKTTEASEADPTGKAPYKCRNIIASFDPQNPERILICAHWDSRPWADNDPDKKNWHKPVMAANDGASGVAVMLEMARAISQSKDPKLKVGIDFICLDAEDAGTPQFSKQKDDESSWCLGSQYWAANPHVAGYTARYGILLDMVGGEGATFYQEGYSLQYAKDIVDKVWSAAADLGYSSIFMNEGGGYVTDDHGPINQTAGIPCIDIIPYSPNNPRSSFGDTWHTINDTMEHISKSTLKAVGETIMNVIYNEE